MPEYGDVYRLGRRDPPRHYTHWAYSCHHCWHVDDDFPTALDARIALEVHVATAAPTHQTETRTLAGPATAPGRAHQTTTPTAADRRASSPPPQTPEAAWTFGTVLLRVGNLVLLRTHDDPLEPAGPQHPSTGTPSTSSPYTVPAGAHPVPAPQRTRRAPRPPPPPRPVAVSENPPARAPTAAEPRASKAISPQAQRARESREAQTHSSTTPAAPPARTRRGTDPHGDVEAVS